MKILLPIDASKFSQEAIKTVLRQYPRRGSQVRVMHVVEPISAYMSADLMPHIVRHLSAIENDRKREAQTLVIRASRKLRAAGFRTSGLVVMGKPAAAIISQAKRWGADVIVIASYGLRGLNRLIMGSISESVARHADCTVEVVRVPRSSSKKPAKRTSSSS